MTPTGTALSASGSGSSVHVYDGNGITVTWDQTRCQHFAECVRGLPAVFDTGRRPWVQPERASADDIAHVIQRCPTGALHYSGAEVEAERGDELTSLERLPTGQLLIRGDLVVDVPTGETVRETRMVACGCGRSRHQPFCDGLCTHAAAPSADTNPS